MFCSMMSLSLRTTINMAMGPGRAIQRTAARVRTDSFRRNFLNQGLVICRLAVYVSCRMKFVLSSCDQGVSTIETPRYNTGQKLRLAAIHKQYNILQIIAR